MKSTHLVLAGAVAAAVSVSFLGCDERGKDVKAVKSQSEVSPAIRGLSAEDRSNKDAICDSLRVKNPKAADSFGCGVKK